MNHELSQVSMQCLLHAAAFHAKPIFIKLADEHGLTYMQLFTLLKVSPEKPLPMHAVSEYLACDASNVTGIVERLVNHGLVVREEKPEDRRVKVIKLTAAGITMRKDLLARLAVAEKETNPLSDDEQRQLKKLLRAYIGESHDC